MIPRATSRWLAEAPATLTVKTPVTAPSSLAIIQRQRETRYITVYSYGPANALRYPIPPSPWPHPATAQGGQPTAKLRRPPHRGMPRRGLAGRRYVRTARLFDMDKVLQSSTLPELDDVRIMAMSPQAFTLTGFERVDGVEYAQSWLVAETA